MDKLSVLPLFGSIALLGRFSAREVFILYFIPVFLLIPHHFQTKLVGGIPELAFWSSALIPIIFVWIARDGGEGYEFSFMDVPVFLLIIVIFLGQFYHSGYKDAQKLLFNLSMIRIFPYLFAKSIFVDKVLRVKFLKMLAGVGAIIGFMDVYEFRLWYNVFDKPLRRMWPTWLPWGMPMKRWGFKRAVGPFSHPILAGYFFATMTPMAFWLFKYKKFAGKYTSRLVLIGNAAGCFAAISRAPILGMFMSFFVMWYGGLKNKILGAIIIIALGTTILAIFLPKFQEYVSPDISEAETVDQRNAAYRRQLMVEYKEIVKAKPYFGWGRSGVPWLEAQSSIDNEYLLLALMHGYVTLVFYVALMVFFLLRATIYVFSTGPPQELKLFIWCLIGAMLSAVLIQATVFVSYQVEHLFFMVLGMGEALFANPDEPVSMPQTTGAEAAENGENLEQEQLTPQPGFRILGSNKHVGQPDDDSNFPRVL